MQNQSPRSVNQTLATANIIWGALFITPGILAFQIYQLSQTWEPPQEFQLNLNDYILLGAALVSIVLSFVLPNLLFQAVLKNPATAGQSLEQRIVGNYFVAQLMRWALIESVTILGFVHSIQNKHSQLFYPLFAISLVLYLLSRPSEDAVRKRIQEARMSGKD